MDKNSTLVYLSLGSNLGNRRENLDRAMDALADAGVQILRRSSIYETEPVDYLEQPWFLNCVVEVRTFLEPDALLGMLQGIEAALGSKKLIPRGPRLIDLDILFYGTSVIKTEAVEIPHPRMAGRRFVLVPLAELAPQLLHPVQHRTVADLLESTPDISSVKPWP